RHNLALDLEWSVGWNLFSWFIQTLFIRIDKPCHNRTLCLFPCFDQSSLYEQDIHTFFLRLHTYALFCFFGVIASSLRKAASSVKSISSSNAFTLPCSIKRSGIPIRSMT